MRVNVYSQELTTEVLSVTKKSNTGIEYKAIQFVLHSSSMLHAPPKDDDRSAVTFWLPQSDQGLMDAQYMFEQAAQSVRWVLKESRYEHGTNVGTGHDRIK